MTHVTFDLNDEIATLRFQRAEAGNAVTPAVIGDLDRAIDAVASSDAKAMILAGAGPNFCVGADLKHFAGLDGDLSLELDRMATAFHASLARMTDLPLPVIASVQGAAVGAGFGLALASDHIVCADTARFSTGYARLGLSADAGVSYFLTRALGIRRARSLLMSARFLDAEEARTLGLVEDVCLPADLAARTQMVARVFADGPNDAYGAIKRLTDEAMQGPSLRSHLDREQVEIVTLARSSDRFLKAAQALRLRSEASDD